MNQAALKYWYCTDGAVVCLQIRKSDKSKSFLILGMRLMKVHHERLTLVRPAMRSTWFRIVSLLNFNACNGPHFLSVWETLLALKLYTNWNHIHPPTPVAKKTQNAFGCLYTFLLILIELLWDIFVGQSIINEVYFPYRICVQNWPTFPLVH